MRKDTVGLVVAMLLTMIAAAEGQTLECGYVTLRIGEAEKEAVAQLNGAGYKNFASVDESEPKTFQTFLGPGDLPSHPVALPANICEVEFVQHKITYVARHWTKDVKSDLDAVHNIIEAFHAIVPFAKHDACDIFDSYQSTPEYESKSVTVSCGSHRLRVSAGKDNGKPTYDIEENIGTMT
jgi:hypothetical protein